jgi:hypothetical protein
VSDDLPASGNDDFVPHTHGFDKFADANAEHGVNTEDEKLDEYRDADDPVEP